MAASAPDTPQEVKPRSAQELEAAIEALEVRAHKRKKQDALDIDDTRYATEDEMLEELAKSRKLYNRYLEFFQKMRDALQSEKSRNLAQGQDAQSASGTGADYGLTLVDILLKSADITLYITKTVVRERMFSAITESHIYQAAFHRVHAPNSRRAAFAVPNEEELQQAQQVLRSVNNGERRIRAQRLADLSRVQPEENPRLGRSANAERQTLIELTRVQPQGGRPGEPGSPRSDGPNVSGQSHERSFSRDLESEPLQGQPLNNEPVAEPPLAPRPHAGGKASPGARAEGREVSNLTETKKKLSEYERKFLYAAIALAIVDVLTADERQQISRAVKNAISVGAGYFLGSVAASLSRSAATTAGRLAIQEAGAVIGLSASAAAGAASAGVALLVLAAGIAVDYLLDAIFEEPDPALVKPLERELSRNFEKELEKELSRPLEKPLTK